MDTGNPFLMDEGPTQAVHSKDDASNPFLDAFADNNNVNAQIPENPFLVDDLSYEISNVSSTNPFALSEAEVSPYTFEDVKETNVSTEYAATELPSSISTNKELEQDVSSTTQTARIIEHAMPEIDDTSLGHPCIDTDESLSHTKYLISSVTGTMEETSSKMLDRLEATKTPSPTLMHSPSPTPENSYVEFAYASDKARSDQYVSNEDQPDQSSIAYGKEEYNVPSPVYEKEPEVPVTYEPPPPPPPVAQRTPAPVPQRPPAPVAPRQPIPVPEPVPHIQGK